MTTQKPKVDSSRTRMLPILADVEALLKKYIDDQDAARGNWDPGRFNNQGDGPPVPPKPSADNPMLAFLFDDAQRNVVKDDLASALINLAVHAWMEGHIEGYDRAMREHTS